MTDISGGAVIHEIIECDVVCSFTYDGKSVENFDANQAMAYLLGAEKCVLAELKTGGLGILVICSDTFMWACTEYEPIEMSELRELYDMVRKDKSLGADVWCCKRRNHMPQAPVAAAIRKAGIWPIDDMGLEPNWYDKACRENAA